MSNLDKYKQKKNMQTTKKDLHQKKEQVKTEVINKKDENNFTFFEKYNKYFPILIILIVFIVFYNSINNGFINWDDDRYITGNKQLDLTWENIKFYFTNFYFVMYIPFSMISYMFDYSIVGLNEPWFYHLHNLILHIITSILVYFFVKKLFENKNKEKYIYAFFTALLFGIHPLHVESVSWIAERKDVLYSAYFVASLLSYLHYFKSKKLKYYILSFVLFLFSLLSKTQAVVLPILLLVLDYYLRNFVSSKEEVFNFLKFKDKNQWKIFAEKIPFFILSLIFGLIAFKASATNEPFADSFSTNTKTAVDTGFNLIETIVLISHSLFLYISNLIFPINQSAVHPYPFESGELPVANFLFLIVLIGYIFSIIWFWIKQKKEIVLGLLFFIFNIFIVLHIKNFLISEHYAYLPAIGISLLLINFVLYIFKTFKKFKVVILAIVVAYILVLSFITIKRNTVFKNSETFWTDVVTKYPQVFIGFYNRGNYYQEQGDFAKEDKTLATNFYLKAIDDYSLTISKKGNDKGALSNRGITFAKIGKYKEAIADFDQVVKIDSTYGNVYSNRGNAKALSGDYLSSISDYNKALLLNPNLVDAIYNRGVAYSSLGQNKKAIADFNKVLLLTPDKADILSLRGLCYYYDNNLDSALIDFNNYLKVNMSASNILYYRALTYEKKNQTELAKKDFETIRNNYPELIDEIIKVATNIENSADYYRDIKLYNDAIDMFKDILKINPNHSIAYSRIGVIYGKIGNFNLAFENLNKAISLDSKNYQAIADRGYAYMLTGNNSQAIKDMTTAISLKSDDYITYYNRALLNFKLGKNIDAISDLDNVIKLNVEYSPAYILRGQAFVKLSKKNEACSDFSKALELENKDASFYLNQYCK